MPLSSEGKLQHLPGLDGLRAIAITLVILFHVSLNVGPPFPVGHLTRLFVLTAGGGWIGVDLFFVLSGFLITRILFKAKGQAHYFRNFYARRSLRIFPLYYFYLLMVLFVLPLSGGALGTSFWQGHHLAWNRASLLFYFYNFRVAHLGGYLDAVSPLWSLSVEEHFYLVWPLLVSVFSRFTLMRVALIGALCAFLVRFALLHSNASIEAPYVLTPARIDGLLLGSFVALANFDKGQWIRLVKFAPWSALTSFLGLVALVCRQGHFYNFLPAVAAPDGRGSYPILLYGISLLAIFFFSSLVLVVENRSVQRLLEWAPMRPVGRYSYGIYVYHALLLPPIAGELQATALLAHLSRPANTLIVTAAAIVICAAVAALSYRFLELPFLKLKVNFPERGEDKSFSNPT